VSVSCPPRALTHGHYWSLAVTHGQSETDSELRLYVFVLVSASRRFAFTRQRPQVRNLHRPRGECPGQSLGRSRPHQTLSGKGRGKVTPAMAAGVETHPWSITQLCELLED
jgi:hypothetical protein